MNGLRVLLWKDTQLARGYLRAAGAALAAPYLVLLSIRLRGAEQGAELWSERVFQAGLIAGLATIAATALLAGSSLAAERTDRSSEFLNYLPVERGARLISKLLVVLCPLLIMSLGNPLILLQVVPNGWPAAGSPAGGAITTLGCSIMLVSGVAWLGSARISAAAALLLGLLAPFFVTALYYAGAVAIEHLGGKHVNLDDWFALAYRIAGVTLGFIAWGAGSWLFLQGEPESAG